VSKMLVKMGCVKTQKHMSGKTVTVFAGIRTVYKKQCEIDEDE